MNPGGYGGGGYGPPDGGYGTPPRDGASGGWGGGDPGAFAPPPQGMPPGYEPPTGASAMGGVPWEQPGGSLFGKWWDTVKAANGDTRSFFAAAARNESVSAIGFSTMTGALSALVVAVLSGLWIALFGAMILSTVAGLGGRGGTSTAMGMGAFGMGLMLVYVVMIAISIVFAAAIGPFIVGGIHHVILTILGGVGPGKTYMHTVRVVAYGDGAARAWSLIPLFGGLIYAVFNIKNLVQGYDETHRCGVGKALFAVFSPLICCCLCYVVGLAFVGMSASATGHH